jgi:hypothetical protein
VVSIFFSEDGGNSWTPVSGNLEEFPDGTGSGPSVRCTKKVSYLGKKIYFAGTSCGFFSSRELTGDSTVWIREGANTIGNVIVDMLDARQTDGFIAVGTHGNGVYSAYFDPSAGVEGPGRLQTLTIGEVFPNPAGDMAKVMVSTDQVRKISASLYSGQGKEIRNITAGTFIPGTTGVQISLTGLPPGVYFLVFRDGIEMITRKVIRQ